MRFVAILVVLAIIYVAYSKRVKPTSGVDEAMDEFHKTAPATPMAYSGAATPAPAPAAANGQPSSGLRRPIDTTRAVLDRVKERNGDF